MDAPDPNSSGIAQTAQKPQMNQFANRNNVNNTMLGVPDMNRDNSNKSLLRRDGSQNRLVEDKQLGPAKMKAKVGTGIAYKEWPAA